MKAWEVALRIWCGDQDRFGLGLPMLVLIESRARGVKPSTRIAYKILREMKDGKDQYIRATYCETTEMVVFSDNEGYYDQDEEDGYIKSIGHLIIDDIQYNMLEYQTMRDIISSYEVNWRSNALSRNDLAWTEPTEEDEQFIDKVLKKAR